MPMRLTMKQMQARAVPVEQANVDLSKPGLSHWFYYHDGWCPKSRGGEGLCICNPEVRVYVEPSS